MARRPHRITLAAALIALGAGTAGCPESPREPAAGGGGVTATTGPALRVGAADGGLAPPAPVPGGGAPDSPAPAGGPSAVEPGANGGTAVAVEARSEALATCVKACFDRNQARKVPAAVIQIDCEEACRSEGVR